VVEAGTVRRLLEIIEARTARLEKVAGTPREDYLGNPDLQDIVERNFEIAIQACIDLALHVLADLPRPLPETNRDAFAALAREGLLKTELAAELEKMAGFRNLLAHGYGDIEAARVHGALARLDDIRSYTAQLMPHLRERGVSA
jgi:uncharacterized protein YutE (UPF0331/DUF86 family)